MNNAIGTWSAVEGMNILESNIWERRSNLWGSTLRCSTVKYPVLSNLTYGSDKQITGKSGYYWDVFAMLEAELNFTSRVTYSVDGKFGSVGQDGKTWNGMVGMLMRNETDLAVAGLTYTPQRKEVISYTIPIFARVPVSCITPRNQGG